jgi:hypothetical protein
MNNLTNITVLEELAQYINNNEDWQLDVTDIIERNGWNDETGEAYGVCSNDYAKVVLNERGTADVISLLD